MLKRTLVGLILPIALQLASLPAAQAGSSDVASVRSMRASAMQHCAQGDVELGLKTFEDAIRLAEKTFGKDSTYVADLCFDAGMAALKTDHYQKAEDCLTKSISVNPNSNEARLKLAEYYRLKGRLGDAKQQIGKVLGKDPINAEAHELMALTLQKEGNVMQANEESLRLEKGALAQELANIAQVPAQPPAIGFSRIAPAVKPALEQPVTGASADAGKAPIVDVKKPPAVSDVKKAPPAKNSAADEAAVKTKDRAAAAKKRADLEKERARVEQELAKLNKHSKPNKATPNGERKRRESSQADDDSGSFGTHASMHSKAVLLTPIKKASPASVESEQTEQAAPVVPAPPKPKRSKHGRGGSIMVPPPPVQIPNFGAPPPPVMPLPKPIAPGPRPAAPKPAASSPKLKEAIPREDPGEDTPKASPPPRASSESRSESHSSSSSDDDADFLLDWAGKKKKKGK
jgi:tetratricopeptide (TPR) repeat protein